MIVRIIILFFLMVNLVGCEKERDLHVSVSDINQSLNKLVFVCINENAHLPAISERALSLYRYGRFLASSPGEKNYAGIGRLYRLAYADGNYKAATNLHALISQGLITSENPEKEVIDIVENLISQGIPGGYYDMGHYLEAGYGVKQDASRAHAYFRRAADMGNPDAQFYVSTLLEEIESAEPVVIAMRRCAMNQGHAKSALNYGLFYKVRGDYPEAIKGFQAGTRNGDSTSASFLSEGFSTSDPKDRLNYFALSKDSERARRYEKISQFLDRYESLGATVPDIDNIVPLPPAKLPDWDGTFEWQKKRDSTPPPEKPSEEMIRALSQEKGLDSETGLPLITIK
ncbi:MULTISPECIES: sel1 repeat family protein [Pseudomonas]|uniref:SEL1-like repeat protein n=1 Tax=Pseudomonas TaxID=286 RepID=UPI001AEADA9B|nr:MULTISPECIES: sel1 repeat family protein [unclassified Pseudomonas]MBP1127896.1 TPR repeat protein [Pseudomonas sp. PvP025]MDQ0396834.1 TPR repeat protein [Pseudomonas sp. PvP006]